MDDLDRTRQVVECDITTEEERAGIFDRTDLGKGAGHAARQSQGHNCSSYVPTCHDQRGSRDRLRGRRSSLRQRHGSGSVTCPEAGLELDAQFGQGLPRCECIGEESDEFGMTTTCRHFGN
jgi:hypothetical protein